MGGDRVMARRFTPKYVQLVEVGQNKAYSYTFLPNKLAVDELHMIVTARSGKIATRATAVFQVLEMQYFPPGPPLNAQYKLNYVHLDEEVFIHVSIPAQYRATCEKIIKQCQLTICTHKSITTELTTGASVVIPNAQHLLQLCEPGIGAIKLSPCDKPGCNAVQMAEFHALQSQLLRWLPAVSSKK